MGTSALPTPARKAHQEPRISLNKLGEYLDATVTRRRTIVKDQKKPPGAGIVTRYSHVTTALAEYFEDSNRSYLLGRIEKLKADKSGTEWQREDRQLSAEVLVKLIDLVEEIDLTGVRVISSPAGSPAAIQVKGVRVSVRPDFLVVLEKDPEIVVGAIKLSHNKQHALQKMACECVATMLWRYLQQTFPAAKVDLKKCLSISTPLKLLVSAPKSYKARNEAMDAACEEIAARWPAV